MVDSIEFKTVTKSNLQTLHKIQQNVIFLTEFLGILNPTTIY